MYKFFSFFLFLFSVPSFAQTGMTNAKMETIIQQMSEEMDGTPGNWQAVYGNRLVFILTDEAYNRMRIFTPIGQEEELEEGQLKAMLSANFHSALDAKYGLYNGFIVSLFTHPLKELTEDQLRDAIRQVAIAANNFGTTYSSTDLIFGGETEESDPTPKEKDKRVNQKPKKRN